MAFWIELLPKVKDVETRSSSHSVLTQFSKQRTCGNDVSKLE